MRGASALARSYGANGILIEKTEAFPAAFEEALAADRPTLMELKVAPQAITPKQTLDEIRGSS